MKFKLIVSLGSSFRNLRDKNASEYDLYSQKELFTLPHKKFHWQTAG